MTPVPASIRPLGAVPEHVPTLARWFHGEWSAHYGERTPEDVEADFRERLGSGAVPTCLVALEGGDVIGTISLVATSIASHAHLTPWVGGLYVRPDRRSRGVGMALVRAARDTATALGFDCVHAAMHHGREHYVAAGWSEVETLEHDGSPITVLVYRLRSGTTRP